MELIFIQPHLKLHVHEQNKYKLYGTLRGGNQAVARREKSTVIYHHSEEEPFPQFPESGQCLLIIGTFSGVRSSELVINLFQIIRSLWNVIDTSNRLE